MLKNDVLCCDAFDGLSQLAAESIDLCVTDPPYFLDKLDNEWSQISLSQCEKNHIGNLPPGMKFDKEQVVKLEHFYSKVSEEVFRVLKPRCVFYNLFFSKTLSCYSLGS